MTEVLFPRNPQKAVDDGDDQQTQYEYRQYIDRGNQTEFSEELAVGKNEGGETRGRGKVGQQGGVPNPGYYPLKTSCLIPMFADLLLVLIDQEDTVRNPNYNDQGGNDCGKNGDFIIKKAQESKGPHHTDADGYHRNHGRPDRPEKEKEKQGGNQKGCTYKHADLIDDILGVEGPDVGHARDMNFQAVFFLEFLYCRKQLLKNKPFSDRGINNLFVQVKGRLNIIS